jgi:cysteine-rich repeat protein
MRIRRCLALLLLVASVLRGAPAVATTADQVCTGDPCVLSGTVTVTPGSVLDFQTRAFRMTRSGTLVLGDGDTLTIHARTMTMEPGAIIRGPLFPSVGSTIIIATDEDVLIQRSAASRARIDVHGQGRGGAITIDATRNVDLAGDLRADGTQAEAVGGTVDVAAVGTITMTGEINVSGGIGVDGSGGAAKLEAGGALVAGVIDASSGSGDGSVDLISGATLTATGQLSVVGNAAGGGGGDVTLDAVGNVVVSARIAAQGGVGSVADDGLGGDVSISSDGSVRVNERIEAFGGGPGGEAGFVSVTAGTDLTITQPLSVHGPGAIAGGGFVDLHAISGVLTLDGLIDVHGFSAGSVTALAGAQVRARAEINADGQTGEIELSTVSISGQQTPGPVVVSGNVHARGPAGGFSGTIALQGCDLTVEAAGRLVTAGSGAINRLRSSRQMTIAGQVISGPPGANRFEYRDAPNDPSDGLVPIVAPSAVVQPPAALVPSGGLLPCQVVTPVGCGNGMVEGAEGCDDGNTNACDGCSATCTPEACGNSMVECAETCDDGNTDACDGCSATCTQESCGNSMVECTEGCDDGNVTDGDGCDANCTTTGCGNGRVTGTEQCDDGNTTPGDGCDASCQVETPAGCGNGAEDPGEECDDGNTNDCDGCSRTCLDEVCGNNRVECAEVCDEGNAEDCDGDGCARDCLRQEICGDGVKQCQEQCDAGDDNSQPGVGCNTLCRLCALGTDGCPCGADSDCHQLGKCGGFACAEGVCAPFAVLDCDDDNVCNGVETCADGACVPGTPLQCADADVCTGDSCNPQAGCQHAQATGLSSVSCRVEALRLALDGAPAGEVPDKVRLKLDRAADKLQLAVDLAAGAGNDARRLARLLKRVEKRAKKVIGIVTKASRKNQLPAALAESLRRAADGALVAAQGLRRNRAT